MLTPIVDVAELSQNENSRPRYINRPRLAAKMETFFFCLTALASLAFWPALAQDCSSDAANIDYMGSLSRTVTNETCLYWKDVADVYLWNTLDYELIDGWSLFL